MARGVREAGGRGFRRKLGFPENLAGNEKPDETVWVFFHSFGLFQSSPEGSSIGSQIVGVEGEPSKSLEGRESGQQGGREQPWEAGSQPQGGSRAPGMRGPSRCSP